MVMDAEKQLIGWRPGKADLSQGSRGASSHYKLIS